jgi:prephenate dehydratase
VVQSGARRGHWLDVSPTAKILIDSIATLGPEGTSSEAAAKHLWNVRGPGGEPVVQLYDTYEEAGDALQSGRASHLVVANAYSAINIFYMAPSMSLVIAFLFETPPYGLATRNPAKVPREVRVASHPAPIPLIGELLPASYALAGILCADSTSAAALKAQRSEIDLALTTQSAAAVHKLQFISKTRTISMLWSVFTLQQPPS